MSGGDTHLFSIPKKRQTLVNKDGEKIRMRTRMLVLTDIANDTNSWPEAFWDCSDAK